MGACVDACVVAFVCVCVCVCVGGVWDRVFARMCVCGGGECE